MKTFLIVLLGSAVVGFGLMMLLVALLGDGGFLVAGLLAAGALFGLLACVLDKLDRVEEKLDRLLKEKGPDSH